MNELQEQHCIEPHKLFPGIYGDNTRRLPFVRGLFNSTAPYYDAINQLFSLGSGAWYRRRCLLRAGLQPDHRIIDVAIGTGLLAQEAVAITGDCRQVIGVDLSEGMLAIAREKLGIPLVQGAAEALPIADGAADFVTLGYALRHMSDLVVTFREFHRVLRVGGTVLVLEISLPDKKLNRALASTYLGWMVPLLSRFVTGDVNAQKLMQYHWETIEQCVPPQTILDAMSTGGFDNVHCTTDLDFFRSYVGRKF